MVTSLSFSRLFALLLGCLLACSVLASSVRADIPRPPRPQVESLDGQLVIRADGDGKAAHLRLPRSALQSLAPRGGGQPRSDSGISPARTAVAGLALASALAVSGIFLTRSRLGRGRSAIIVAIVASIGVATTATFADLSPINPNSPRWHRLTPPPDVSADMAVVIDVVDDGPVQLTLPADQAARVAQLPTTRPAAPIAK